MLTVKLGDSTHLGGMRGTAVGVEAAVMTCRICSSAERPPPTWKATWSALFCWGKDRERGFHGEDEAKSGCYDSQAGRGFTRLPREGGASFSNRSDGLKFETKWSQKYSCLISKVHKPTPPQSSQVSIADKCSAGLSEHRGGLSQTTQDEEKLRKWQVMDLKTVVIYQDAGSY